MLNKTEAKFSKKLNAIKRLNKASILGSNLHSKKRFPDNNKKKAFLAFYASLDKLILEHIKNKT